MNAQVRPLHRLVIPALTTVALTASLWAQSADGTRVNAEAADLTSQSQAKQARNIQTVDYLIPHISTVYANAGKRVELFVREKVQSGQRGNRPVVLMVHGATFSTIPVFDLQFQNYSWMEYLANAGFDVFAMDQTGYGLSPRPMMENPCNSATADQQSYLVPKTLTQPCTPAYPFQLTSLQTDWDEIDTVVDYPRRVRNTDKLYLVGWSRGGLRAGGYAALHPEKVARLFLYAPGQYFRLSPSDPPPALPVPGVPMTVLGSAAFHNTWDTQVSCANQYVPNIRPALTATILDFDPLGSSWGTAGTRRAPVWNSPGTGFVEWGGNAQLFNRLKVPTLVIRGDLDSQVPAGQINDILGDMVSVPQKVFVHVECASHYLLWENQHMSLLDASVEWLSQGTYKGQFNGTFFVDKAGQVHQTPII